MLLVHLQDNNEAIESLFTHFLVVITHNIGPVSVQITKWVGL